jgi:hypothetical protein
MQVVLVRLYRVDGVPSVMAQIFREMKQFHKKNTLGNAKGIQYSEGG